MSKKRWFIKPKPAVLHAAIAVLVVVVIILLPLLGFFAYFSNKIYPDIYIANIAVGGKTQQEALSILESRVLPPTTLTFASNSPDGQQFLDIPLSDLEFSYDFLSSVEKASQIGRNSSWFKRQNIDLDYSLDANSLEKKLADIAGKIALEPVYPKASLVGGEIIIEKGKAGFDINTDKLRAEISKQLKKGGTNTISIETVSVDPSLNATEVEQFKNRAKTYLGKSLKLEHDVYVFEYSAQEILDLLSPESYADEVLNKKIETVTSEVNREPQNPTFVFDEGKVKEFAPAKNGLRVKSSELKNIFIATLDKLATDDAKEQIAQIPVSETPPEVSTQEVNNLGIKELIGRGTSTFRGSIASRVHNVALAASRINGTLVKPGETFSFNAAVGDISKLTGFKEAYVIKDGKTVLGDGGGVCQVSTTLFRASLSAGVPIVERRAHAYRVYYYEQDSGPGLDATVYSPTTDFKFVNDTPAHILIQAKTDVKNLTLVFELYGTSDGRIATTSKPRTTEVSAPGEDLYQDDPTLPAGVIRQTEHRAFGAKVIFDYEVKRGDQVIYTKKFISNYRPWQAVYLRGTGVAQ